MTKLFCNFCPLQIQLFTLISSYCSEVRARTTLIQVQLNLLRWAERNTSVGADLHEGTKCGVDLQYVRKIAAQTVNMCIRMDLRICSQFCFLLLKINATFSTTCLQNKQKCSQFLLQLKVAYNFSVLHFRR